ncbi:MULTISPECIES: RusA family crossover junction endodeoxyribonuclease [Peptostreptococcus]|uniref:RusA family crossover junction endodeoxyribonuclease n=1 Tax=Peptostreptococcus TaxID=1257 RepID=UPI00290B038B|nr:MULTISPECIES: RusA family crossover junction endodeoxyribonuclease [Peptostreptococcus]MDU3423141.1 RusA family crossover junction endodeoxyribonuclease [Peptostreptococcus anaerobius]MDU3430440.1 RusA family crossover junction endodeoxyribonuclease [Peptostreptococcus sp.]MDU3455427.1 RusA family crossover junction endodeoxyribonuclease [Peptostreptococcus sp.]MDU5987170.1 RusA family crossover junction endodeoxyribonuclease [Peptostreptococcus anaerobius]
MLNLTIYGRPITKKNSSRIVTCGGYPRLIPSKAYVHYQKDSLRQITGRDRVKIDQPINLKVLYYMPTRHRVDLVNLLEATCDILVDAGVLADDNSKIVVSHDGSRVLYDKDNPRTEIYIENIKEMM